MIKEPTNLTEELVRLCRIIHVKHMDVFGSTGTGEFDQQTGDVDFLVVFEALSATEHADVYFDLLSERQTLLSRRNDISVTLYAGPRRNGVSDNKQI